MNFPLFYKGRDPRTSKGRCEINECQIPVLFDGVSINPGDYIFGDIDGVVIIPKDIVEEVLEQALATVKKEDEVRAGLQAGEKSGTGICCCWRNIGVILEGTHADYSGLWNDQYKNLFY